MARKKRPSKKKTLSAFWYIITAIAGVIFSASMISIFNNQGQVEMWIFWSLGGSISVIFALIVTGFITTNETIAFRR